MKSTVTGRLYAKRASYEKSLNTDIFVGGISTTISHSWRSEAVCCFNLSDGADQYGSLKESNPEIIDILLPMNFRNDQFPGLYWMPSCTVYKSASKSIRLRYSSWLIDPRNQVILTHGMDSLCTE